MRSALAALVLAGCQHDVPPPAAPPPISRGVLFQAPDSRCSDEEIGVLHTTDPSYLISADELAGRTMRDHRFELQQCVLQRRRYLPDLGGKLVVTIHLDAAGKPSHVETRGPDAELDRCVCAKVLALTFELTSSTVSYPLYFAP